MARRFTTLPGIGRCTIVLEGHDEEQRKRARLVSQVDTGRVYLVTNPTGRNGPAPVTERSTHELLSALSAFTWWIPLGPAIDESEEE